MPAKSLHMLVKKQTGQDVYKCRECHLCDGIREVDMDIPLTTVLKMIMFDDEDVLSCRTVWSDRVLKSASNACKRGLNIHAILLALRDEAKIRGLE